MKKAILILLVIMLAFCLFACEEEKIEGVIVEKIYVPAEIKPGWAWGNRGLHVYRNRESAKYYLIIDTGEEQVMIRVTKEKYEAYSVGDSYTEWE